LEGFEMWCWRKVEISWTDRIKNKEVLPKSQEGKNILLAVKKRVTLISLVTFCVGNAF
jgi:hypothetical protein